MSEINYEQFLSELVKPLVLYPEEVMVKIFGEEDNTITVQIMVNADDIGRVIGKKGRVINSITWSVQFCYSRRSQCGNV